MNNETKPKNLRHLIGGMMPEIQKDKEN